jgi:transposase
VLSLPPSVSIWLCAEAADMRRSFDGLAALVRQALGQDPLSGHLFVFRNKRGDRVKILWWDRSGYALWYKRLEAGAFRFPAGEEARSGMQVNAAELALLLEGIDLAGARRRKRYGR